MKLGRNDPCHCGSAQKYKKCCAGKDAAARSAELQAQQAQLVAAREAELAAASAEGAEAEPEAAVRPKRPKLPTPHTKNPRLGA
jgi:sRNA-binding protein